MSEAIVAKRYAGALFELVVEQGKQESIASELETVKAVFEKDENLIDILSHPRVSMEQKNQLINTAFKDFDLLTVNTIKLLIKRGRIANIVAVIDDYIALSNEANGIAVATVYSVRALTDNEKSNLEATFKVQLNKQAISIVNVIDPSLIGGVRIRIGNTIYDGSISNTLNRFKQNLVSASK